MIDEKKVKEIALSPWLFDHIKGTNPKSWPIGLDQFYTSVLKLKPMEMFYEPFEILHQDFKTKFNTFIESMKRKISEKQNIDQNLSHLGKALVSFLKLSVIAGSCKMIVIL